MEAASCSTISSSAGLLETSTLPSPRSDHLLRALGSSFKWATANAAVSTITVGASLCITGTRQP